MASINKAAPVAVSSSCIPVPLTMMVPRGFSHREMTLWAPHTGRSQTQLTASAAAPHTSPLLSVKHKENQRRGALLSIADNVQRCVRCGHLTPNLTRLHRRRTAAVRSRCRRSVARTPECCWTSHVRWIPFDRLLPGFIWLLFTSHAPLWQRTKTLVRIKKTWNRCITRVLAKADLGVSPLLECSTKYRDAPFLNAVYLKKSWFSREDLFAWLLFVSFLPSICSQLDPYRFHKWF